MNTPNPNSPPPSDPPTLHPSATPTPTPDPNAAPPSWQEYVDDPAKSAEENAAAKAEHDKTKPPAEPEKKDPPAAPVKLTDLTLPEGLTVSEEQFTELSTLLDNPDPKARVQGLLDLYAKQTKKASEKGSQAWDALQEDWQKGIRENPTYGGAKLNESLGAISKLIDEFSENPAEVRAALDLTKAGNHPAVFSMLAKVAAALSEGKPAPGATPVDTRDAAAKMYPTMKA